MDNLNFTIFDVVRGLRRNWFTVVKSVFGVTFLVMLITILVPKTYSSKSKLLVNLGRENVAVDPSASIGGSGVLAMPLSREAEINSVAEMMTNNQLFYSVVEKIGPEYILEKKTFTLEQWQEEKESAVSQDGEDDESSSDKQLAQAETVPSESTEEELAEEGEEVDSPSDQAPGLVDNVMGTLQGIGVISKVPLLEKAVIQFRKNLVIEPIERSNIVTVEYECHDPELAQLVVQTFVDQYKKVHSNVHRPTGSFDFLSGEMVRIEKEMHQKSEMFEKFKKDTGILDIVQQKSGLIARLQKAREESDVVSTEVNVLAKEILVIEENLKKIKKLEIQEQITGAGNRAIDQLQVQLADFYRQLELVKRTSVGSKAREESIKAKIKRQQATIAELRKQSETRMGANKVYVTAKSNLEVKRPRLAALEEKKVRLANKIGQLDGLLREFSKHEKEFEKLQVDVLLATQAYKKVASNLQQAKIDQGRQNDGISNISQPQAPHVNYKPVSPNKLLNLLGGIFFGGILGCGLAVLKEYKSVNEQIEEQQQNESPEEEPSSVEPVAVENNQASAFRQTESENSTSAEDRVPVHHGAGGNSEMDEDLRERPAEWTTESEN